MLALIFILLTGCQTGPSDSHANSPSLTIVLKDQIPSAPVGEAYDLASAIRQEEDVEYDFSATYIDPESNETEELKVKKGKITPKTESDISVTVTATRGEDSASLDFVVPIRITADILDQLLCSGGIAGQAGPQVDKQISKDTNYIYGDSSISSLKVSFPGNNQGISLLDLSHYSLQSYFSAQIWRNAAVSFWVYNPMDKGIDFKLASYDPFTAKSMEWDSSDNDQLQTADPGQWTKIDFSLFRMGITEPLVNTPVNESGAHLTLLANYENLGDCTFYIDNIDILSADTLTELETGYSSSPAPAGDFSDLLKTCKVYTNDSTAKLTPSTKGNGTKDAYCFGASEQAGYPILFVDFPKATDIRGLNYLKFDVYAENAYPFVTASIRYLDAEGQVQAKGCSYDFKRDQWRTLYLNLNALSDVDLSQVVGISFTVHMDSHFVPSQFNCLYFDNVSLYAYGEDEPQIAPATQEDHDILSYPVYLTNYNPATTGICKVATDETGLQKSNSTLLFWTNNSAGYPVAHFVFDGEQDWSNYDLLTFETHQANAHYWMRFEILYLDEDDKQQTLTWHYDTSFNHWFSTNAPLAWFATAEGTAAGPEHLQRVVGFRICVDLKNNVGDEVAYIFFDNFQLT